MRENINIIGCGYIGKKIANLLKDKNPFCFVHSDQSKQVCDNMNLQTDLLNLDTNRITLPQHFKNKLGNSFIVYLVPPPRQGRVDTRMQHFIDLLEMLEISPEKILLISTTGVYGNCKGQWIDESQSLNPQVDRAYRRLSAETILKKYCDNYQLKKIIFRVPGIYAADKLPVKRITSGESIVSALDSGFSNRIHADDLAAFCIEAILREVPSGIYNCCDGKPSTMNNYFIKVADALGLPRPLEISLRQAQRELSAGMLSYLAESKRISNKKLLDNFKTRFKYPDLDAGLQSCKKVQS